MDKYSWYILIQALCIGTFYITCPLAEGMDKCPVCNGTKEISIEKDNGYEDFYFAQKVEWNFLRAFEGFLLLLTVILNIKNL